MPIHFPGLGHKDKHKEEDKEKDHHHRGDPSTVPPPFVPVPHRQSTQSSTSSSNPPSILRRPAPIHSDPTSPTTSTSENGERSHSHSHSHTTGSASISSLSQRMSKGLSVTRTDTADSHDTTSSSLHHRFSSNSNSHSTSTPLTSLSADSLPDQNCPLPRSAPGARFPFFSMTLSSTGTLSFIAMPVVMRPGVIDAVNRAWKKGAGISKITEVDYAPEAVKRAREEGSCDGGVWELTMKEMPWSPTSADRVSSRRILINLFTTFASEGYNLVSSYRTSAKDSSKDTLSFLQGEPDPDPIFMAIAFHSSDKIWIIDAEADVGEAVEEGIRKFWDAGIKDARVRERHCREIRLKGNPWTSHKTNSLISSRIIHLAILKHITHMDRGYDFVGSVDMGDAEEGEMPVTFYRRRWGSQRAVWSGDN